MNDTCGYDVYAISEADVLRGRLEESRRTCRRLRRERDHYKIKAARDAAFWRHLLAAAVALAVALTCLLHSLIYAGAHP